MISLMQVFGFDLYLKSDFFLYFCLGVYSFTS